jgi:hypothetical protein
MKPSSRRALLFALIGLTGALGASADRGASASSAPVLIATGGKTGLEFWPLTAGGSHAPTAIAVKGLSPSGLLAASGSKIVIPNSTNIVVYDVQTKQSHVLPDPYGDPVDAAVAKDGTMVISNFTRSGSNFLVFPPRGKPRDISCGLKGPDYIAIDNEGDLFINDAIRTKVLEIANGSNGLDATTCAPLKLTPGEQGYAGGIAIDPKTDDLLVLDDPDYCAGGTEGRLETFSKPYERGTGRGRDVGRNCSDGLRLDATSSVVFVGDESIGGPPTYIIQSGYPSGKSLGTYSGGSPSGFITVPNTLPN